MKYFAGGNTRNGFVSLFEECISGIPTLFILKGSSGCGKSTLMKKIAKKGETLGFRPELIYCSADPDSLDGVIMRESGFAVVDGTSPHTMDVKYPCARETIINLGQFWDPSKITPHRDEIIRLTDEKSLKYKNAYRALSAAGAMEDIAKTFVTSHLRRKKLDDAVFEFAESVMGDKGTKKRIFASAFTSKGVFSLPAFENVKIIYKIAGKASGIFLTSLVQIAKEQGTEAIVALSPTDGNAPEGIFFQKTGVLVTTNTETAFETVEEHRISTTRFLDNAAISQGKTKLKGFEKISKELLEEAKSQLVLAKEIHNKIEQIYIPAMDFNAMNSFTESLISQIFQS